jgi:hypothetical protein
LTEYTAHQSILCNVVAICTLDLAWVVKKCCSYFNYLDLISLFLSHKKNKIKYKQFKCAIVFLQHLIQILVLSVSKNNNLLANFIHGPQTFRGSNYN